MKKIILLFLFIGSLCTVNAQQWTWLKGDTIRNQWGSFGTKGIVSATNKPSSRQGAASFIDTAGNFWLFGGLGYNSIGGAKRLNDLWKYDGTNWVWVSGSNLGDEAGVYGTLGVPDTLNYPGSRQYPLTWTDNQGNFWLFGGYGFDINGYLGYLNDLWKFDGTNWTWISGGYDRNQSSIVGTIGVPNIGNIPGGRNRSVTWVDANNNLWLYGGDGYNQGGNVGGLDDLWKFDGTSWTWVSGGGGIGSLAVHNTKGQSSSANTPGSRNGACGWIDASQNLYLFGGNSYKTSGFGAMNDLWKYDGTNWTWISGDSIRNSLAEYGTKGIAHENNKPSGRNTCINWKDSLGNFYLIGGVGNGFNNDVWKFDGANWTWVSGSNTTNQIGVYDTQGLTGDHTRAGARSGAAFAINSAGKVYIYGGTGYSSSLYGHLSDLWLYENCKTTAATDTQTACNTYTWLDGITYTESNNTATHTLVNAAGCDSIITLNLSIKQATTATDTQTACNTYTWIDGITYTESNNTATHTLVNAAGCDSIITLNLTINSVNANVSQLSNTLTAETTAAGYQWIDCNNANQAIDGETNQSFTPTANGNYAVTITNNGCESTSSCFTILGLSTNENEFGSEITIYPNPTKGLLEIDLGENQEEIQVVLQNVQGQSLKNLFIRAAKTISLEIEGETGIYFLSIQNKAGNKKVFKIIKE